MVGLGDGAGNLQGCIDDVLAIQSDRCNTVALGQVKINEKCLADCRTIVVH